MEPERLTVETSADWLNYKLQFLRECPDDKAGRGIVICAGGPKFQLNAFVCIRRLRTLGCTLPIECWYLGADERNEAFEDLMAPFTVSFVDAHLLLPIHPHKRLYGWELKPYAIAHSRFREVMALDADNVPVVDPTYLFDEPTYQQTGAMFWPDFGRLQEERSAWRVFDVPYRDEPEVESGQIIIDKRKCWDALELCNAVMQYSDFFFAHVHGDKEVFHLVWRKLGRQYAMPTRGIDALPGTMCQHDFKGNRVFQHRNMRKWSFHDNERTERFQHEDECLALIQELKAVWSPASRSHPTMDDRLQMSRLEKRSFMYHRVGLDYRPMKLLCGVVEPGHGREYYWTVRDGMLRIAGEDGRLTMMLQEKEHGAWVGRWLVHERMPIWLIPTRG